MGVRDPDIMSPKGARGNYNCPPPSTTPTAPRLGRDRQCHRAAGGHPLPQHARCASPQAQGDHATINDYAIVLVMAIAMLFVYHFQGTGPARTMRGLFLMWHNRDAA